MKKVILIRFGEIFLKGKNRGYFEKALLRNIKTAMEPFGAEVVKIPGRYIVTNYAEDIETDIIDRISKVAGIFSFSPAICFETDMEVIASQAVEMMAGKTGTFKVVTNRADKTLSKNSMQISAEIGGKILASNKSLKVDIKNPDHVLDIDIRENKETYMYVSVIAGVGGMPVGTSGGGLLLLSGGIDSPVAGYMVAKRGVNVSAVHFHSYPYTSNFAREKVEDLAKIIAPYTNGLTIYMVSMTELQEQIHAHCDDAYMITLLRRGMFTIAERLCKKYDRKMIVTGENLGQVASQTIESMTVVENVIKDTVVLRPLITFDKTETIDIARKIETFDISVRPYEDCCTVFLPDSPVTRPRLEKVEFEESKFQVDELVNDAYNSIEKIIIK